MKPLASGVFLPLKHLCDVKTAKVNNLHEFVNIVTFGFPVSVFIYSG